MLARLNHSSLDKPGSGLPFYPSEDYISQLRWDMLSKKSTWLCPPGDGIPFQVPSASLAAVTGFSLVSPIDGTTIALDEGAVDSISISGSRKLHFFNGIGGGAVAGTWYYVLDFFGGGRMVSDIFLVDDCDSADTMQLVWWDTKRFCAGVWYDGGDAYKNRMWLQTTFARPKEEYVEEIKTDGYGYPLAMLQRTEDVYVVDAKTCDSQMAVLCRVANHNRIQITYPRLTDLFDVHTFRANDTGEKKDALAITELSFRVAYMENNTQNFDV